MKNCDTILAKHVIAITKQDLINLVVANEAVDMKVDNLIPDGSRCYMETYLPSKYQPPPKFNDFVLFQGKFEEKSLCKVKHVKVIGLDLTQVIKAENRADEEDIEGLRRY